MMKGLTGDQRRIRWTEVAVIAAPDGSVLYSTEVCGGDGIVQDSFNPKHYHEGIWTCSLWSFPERGGKNYFELTEGERAEVDTVWSGIVSNVSSFLKGCRL